MLTWFPFTPLSKPWVSSSRRKLQLLTHTGGWNLARCSHHCLHCLWAHQQECDLKGAAPLNSCRPSYLLSLCLGCSCHKTVSLLAFTLSSVSLVGLLLTQWQLEGLHELWVHEQWSLYLENAGCCLVISIAQLTCKQSAESAFQYFCMMWMPDSRQEMKSWGRRGICCLMTSRS